MDECILFPLTPVVDYILLDHVLHWFQSLLIIWDELSKEVYLSQEGLHCFLVGWVRDLWNGLDSVWINLYPTSRNYVPEVPLRHYKYALFGIQGNPLLPTSFKYFLQVAYVVQWCFWKTNHMIKVNHYSLSDESTESVVHGTLKGCACIHKPKWHSSICKCTPIGMKFSF